MYEEWKEEVVGWYANLSLEAQEALRRLNKWKDVPRWEGEFEGGDYEALSEFLCTHLAFLWTDMEGEASVAEAYGDVVLLDASKMHTFGRFTDNRVGGWVWVMPLNQPQVPADGVRELPSTSPRRNPYRRVAGVETRTWLPDDAGTFTDPDALIRTQGGFRHPAFRKRGGFVILPDGRKVKVKFIARGQWTEAYRGEDGWVYLFSKGDPAKELLVEITRKTADKAFAVHLPWIEVIGFDERSFDVYRMPFYEPLDARNERIAMYLRSVEDDVREDSMVGEDELIFEIARGVSALARKDKERFGLIAKAVKYLADAMDRAGWDYEANFEFPVHNLAQDVEGNLVLLDVIFRADSTLPEKGAPAKPWKPVPGGVDADFGD